MLNTYLRVAWRNLLKHKGYSFIYIAGLAVGIGLALLDGLWIHDELSFNNYHKNHDRIAQVMHHVTFNSERMTLQTGSSVIWRCPKSNVSPKPMMSSALTCYGQARH